MDKANTLAAIIAVIVTAILLIFSTSDWTMMPHMGGYTGMGGMWIISALLTGLVVYVLVLLAIWLQQQIK